jgi:DNA polymerase-3 subunit delta
MIIKNYQLENKNIIKHNFFLFYGDNEGLKNDKIKDVCQTTGYAKFLYYEKEVLNDLVNFSNLLSTKSFFENEKIIIVKNSTDKILNIIKEVIIEKLEGIKIILNADVLDKKSRLRSFFEKEKDLVCIPFYPDDFKNLNFISQNFFREKKIKISQKSINLIIERSNGSREHLKNELQKIALYANNKKEIDFTEVIKLTNLGKNYDISELVETCLVKNQKKVSKIINENNFSNEDTIIIIRTFLLKTKRLLNLSENIKSNPNLEKVVSNYRPLIFWKEKEVVKEQLKIWSEKNLRKLINEISNTELLIKKNTNISFSILLNFIFKNSNIINN